MAEKLTIEKINDLDYGADLRTFPVVEGVNENTLRLFVDINIARVDGVVVGFPGIPSTLTGLNRALDADWKALETRCGRSFQRWISGI